MCIRDRDAPALPRHGVREQHLPRSLATETIFFRHRTVFKEYLAHGRSADSHLVRVVSDGETGRVALHQQSSRSVGAERNTRGLSIGKHTHKMGIRTSPM